MCTTHGIHQAGHVVWLEFVYRRWGGHYMETITVHDYDYNQQMLVEIRSNPDRFGTDPHREEY